MLRLIAALTLALGLAACANGQRDLENPATALGDFQLGFVEVVAPNLVKGPLSRDASAEEWTTAMEAALAERFTRQSGGKYYHIGVSLEGFVLAQPGVPVVLSPKSALIFRVTVWDDAAQAKLNAEPEQITVMESFSAETVAGSGLTQSRDEQMRNLTTNGALQVERWLRRQMRDEGWFGGLPEPAAAKDKAAKTVPE